MHDISYYTAPLIASGQRAAHAHMTLDSANIN